MQGIKINFEINVIMSRFRAVDTAEQLFLNGWTLNRGQKHDRDKHDSTLCLSVGIILS